MKFKRGRVRILLINMNGRIGRYRINEVLGMQRKVSDYIELNHLIEDGDGIVVGVSGGADSVCLLHILFSLYRNSNTKLLAAHINHGIRGRDAELDEEFVLRLCRDIGIECCSFRYDIKKKAEEEGLSEEEAGREARYQAFREICGSYGCNKIAVAHNKNDNAETILFNLFRGSGIKGLSGIDSSRNMASEAGNITVIHPLLSAGRDEIEEYLSLNQIPYRTDLSNLTEDYSRNKIRNQVLNYVTENINKNTINHITEAAAQLEEIGLYIRRQTEVRYAKLMKKEGAAALLPVREMAEEDIVIQKEIILKALEDISGSRKDIESKHVEDILSLFDKQVGKQVHLPYGMLAIREYNEVRLLSCTERKKADRSGEKPMEPIKIEIPGSIYIKKYCKIIETEILQYKNDTLFPKNSCKKWFDYDKIEKVVELRTRRQGDYIQVDSKGGHKKLKDYFIDEKIPKEDRQELLLVTDGSHVMWIPEAGSRMSEKYKVSDKTDKILSMKLIDAKEKEDG